MDYSFLNPPQHPDFEEQLFFTSPPHSPDSCMSAWPTDFQSTQAHSSLSFYIQTASCTMPPAFLTIILAQPITLFYLTWSLPEMLHYNSQSSSLLWPCTMLVGNFRVQQLEGLRLGKADLQQRTLPCNKQYVNPSVAKQPLPKTSLADYVFLMCLKNHFPKSFPPLLHSFFTKHKTMFSFLVNMLSSKRERNKTKTKKYFGTFAQKYQF